MTSFDSLYENGLEVIRDKRVIFCGMVRDCGNAVKKNISTIESIAALFYDYRIVVIENNSQDNTKDVLNSWQKSNNKVTAICNDFDESKYKELTLTEGYFLDNSFKRISKYVDYRNLYMEYIDKMDFAADYVILVDLDVARIDVKGIITSFGSPFEWDAITANGYSLSPKLRRRFHDTYALCEFGKQDSPQLATQITEYRETFKGLKKGKPFVRVFSAYGGLVIFKRDAIRNLRYKIMYNNYDHVEVRCEHFSIFHQMFERGFDKVYINPNMEIYYQKVDFKLIIKKIKAVLGIK